MKSAGLPPGDSTYAHAFPNQYFPCRNGKASARLNMNVPYITNTQADITRNSNAQDIANTTPNGSTMLTNPINKKPKKQKCTQTKHDGIGSSRLPTHHHKSRCLFKLTCCCWCIYKSIFCVLDQIKESPNQDCCNLPQLIQHQRYQQMLQ